MASASAATDLSRMNVESLRYASFDMKLWPMSTRRKCNPKALARAGFYHTPTEATPDAVKCFCCGKELDGWEPSDDPVLEHKKHSPRCAFVNLDLYESRLATFEGFASEAKASNEEFAQAGWVWKPLEDTPDRLECFSCKLSLAGWEPDDDPMEEHKSRCNKKGRPNCTFVWSVLSEEQVNKEQTAAAPVTSGSVRASTRKTKSSVAKISATAAAAAAISVATTTAAKDARVETSEDMSAVQTKETEVQKEPNAKEKMLTMTQAAKPERKVAVDTTSTTTTGHNSKASRSALRPVSQNKKQPTAGETASKRFKMYEDVEQHDEVEQAAVATNDASVVDTASMTVEDYLRGLCDAQIHSAVRDAEKKIAEFKSVAAEARLDLVAMQ